MNKCELFKESLVSCSIDKLFNRLANYIGITPKMLTTNFNASVTNSGVFSNNFLNKGSINKSIVDMVRPITVDGKQLSKFDTFTKILRSWGYQINGIKGDIIYLSPIYNVKYTDERNKSVNAMYKDIVREAAKEGTFYHVSMVPPSKLKELRPKDGNYKIDFETHENAVYMVNTYLGEIMRSDGNNFGDYSDIVKMAYSLVYDHYSRHPNKFGKFAIETEVPYSEQYMEYRHKFIDLQDEDEYEMEMAIPVFIYKLDIGDQFLKERPWKLYFDTSASGGACYVKHTIPKSKIHIADSFFFPVNNDDGRYERFFANEDLDM